MKFLNHLLSDTIPSSLAVTFSAAQLFCCLCLGIISDTATIKLHPLSGKVRRPVATTALAFSPCGILNSLEENAKSYFQIEYTGVIALSGCVVRVAVTARSTAHHLEAMFERVGDL